MSLGLSERLREIQAALSEQNARFSNVKEALAEMPPQAAIELSREWQDAFEDAIEVKPVARRVTHAPNWGAIRV